MFLYYHTIDSQKAMETFQEEDGSVGSSKV